jgi:hypothetical protein
MLEGGAIPLATTLTCLSLLSYALLDKATKALFLYYTEGKNNVQLIN